MELTPAPTIRAMTPADLCAAIDLWTVTDGVGLAEGDDLPGLTRYLKRNPRCSAVAETEEGVIIGAVMSGHDGRRGWLYHLAVASAFRGRGIGRQMVEYAVAALRREGIQRCSLFVFHWCESARDFWQHLGFELRDNLQLMQSHVACSEG